jgi:O-antigen/teichoic acid export membrane protein
MKSRTHKSAWGVASGLFFTVLTVGIGVFSTPWLLYWLGNEQFGAFKVLTDWAFYLPLLELGLGSALSARLAGALGQRDAAQIRQLLRAGLRAYLRVTVLMLACGVAFTFLLPRLFAPGALSPQTIQTAWLILLANVLWYPTAACGSWLSARQELYRLNVIYAAQSLLLTGLCLTMAWRGWGLVGQCLATVLAQAPAAAVFLYCLLRPLRGHWHEARLPQASAALRELNLPAFAYHLSFRVGVMTDTLVVAWFLGPAQVAPFFLTQKLVSLAQTQLLNVGSSTWAGLSELHAQGQAEKFYERVLELTRLISGLGLAFLAPIAALNQFFISLWVGEARYAGTTVTLLACANAWLWSICYLWGWTLQGTGRIARLTKCILAFIAVNLTVSLTATYLWGWSGPLWGTLAGFVLVKLWAFPYVLRQTFGWPMTTLLRCALTPLLWAFPYSVLLWRSAWLQPPETWLNLAVYGSLSCLGGLLLWWLLSLTANERRAWRARWQLLTEKA